MPRSVALVSTPTEIENLCSYLRDAGGIYICEVASSASIAMNFTLDTAHEAGGVAFANVIANDVSQIVRVGLIPVGRVQTSVIGVFSAHAPIIHVKRLRLELLPRGIPFLRALCARRVPSTLLCLYNGRVLRVEVDRITARSDLAAGRKGAARTNLR